MYVTHVTPIQREAMNTDSLGEQVQETLLGIFRRGSRYQRQKICTIGLYFVLSIASLFWAFSGDESNNQLGAKFEKTQLEEIEQDVYVLSNDGDDVWQQIRIVLDKRYLHKRPELKPKERATLTYQDFQYFYYIPRSWGMQRWENLGETPKPGDLAPKDLDPQFVQLRAAQGKLDINMNAK